MDQRSRMAIVIVLAGVIAGLVIFLLMKPGAPPVEEDGLQKLTREFMSCLPSETTDSARDEIQGILDRFHDRAVMDKIHPVDRLAIESNLIGYVTAGEIPKDDLFEFMTKVGEATRRFDPDQQQIDN